MKKNVGTIMCLFFLCISVGTNLQILGTRRVSATGDDWASNVILPLESSEGNSTTPIGLSPAQIRSIYDLPSTGGQGTIAIVDVDDDPTIFDDTNVFSAQYGLPNLTSSNFEKHMMGTVETGGRSAREISLDVQWAHAIAPNAKILLVEAANFSSIWDAVDYARSRTDVIAISLSWGFHESSNETLYDFHLQPLGNPSCCFFAASGDNSENVTYPAASPNVVGVGGTALGITNGSLVSETVWGYPNVNPPNSPGTGGGISRYETEPSYQASYNVSGANGHRCVPDVSFDADADVSGVSVYDSTPYADETGWFSLGGTSLGAPCWAAIYSLGLTASNDRLYAVAKSSSYPSCFRDITNGTNGNYNATTDYDFVTGLGSPLTTTYGAHIDSFNIYFNDATQNLTTLDNNTNYKANINFTWTPALNNVYLDVVVNDAFGVKAWWGLVIYNYLGPGTYNETVDVYSDLYPQATNGTLQITLTSNTINFAAPWTENVNIVNSNHPPNTPSFVWGTQNGYVDVSYRYTVNATDPDNDNIQYVFNWGDGTANTTTAWNPSGLPGTAYHSWASPGIYYVTAYVYDPYGAWNSSTLGPVTIASGGESCPFVSTWNGTSYVLDNNILPQSETSNGTDVTDYYTLEQSLVPKDGEYALLLSEFEREHSFIDYAQLLAVDHRANVNVGVSPSGQVLTYTHPYPAASAITNEGKSVRQLLSQADGNYYQGYNGSYVTLNFGRLDLSRGAKLVIVSDMIIIKCPIYIQTLDVHGNWQTVATIYTRNHWATDVIDLRSYLPEAQGRLMVRLCFVHNDTVDFVGLDTSPQATIDIHPGQLVSAFSSTDGDVTANLLYADKSYAELVPGENIQLTFNLPSQTTQARTYIIVTEGHYYTITP